MKLSKQIVLAASLFSLSYGASAVEKNSSLVNFAAVEGYMCNYREDKGREDLEKVIAKWNDWMDSNKSAPYTAWVLTPLFSSTNIAGDFLWLGAWQNGKQMGAGLQAWAEQGGDLMAEFDEVMDCLEHSNFASLNLQTPAEGWPGKTGIVSFTNCTVADGGSIEEAVEVHQTLAQNRFSQGSKSGTWAFFPGSGHNNPDWHYKVITSYGDLSEWGAAWDRYTNGQGWLSARELTAGVVSCDSPRVYQSATVRDGGINPAGQ